MTVIPVPLYGPGAPTSAALYYATVGLWAWAVAVAGLALWMRHLRRQNERLLKSELKDATVAAPGQPDQPAAIDTLGLGVAPVVVGLLTHPNTDEPYTIALSGGWGSGKSSVMLQIKTLLTEAKHPFKFVDINAWYFQQEGDLLTGFLRRILNECESNLFRWRQIKHNLRNLGFMRTLWRAWVLALALPVLLLVLVSLGHGLGDFLAGHGWKLPSLAWPAFIEALIAGVRALLRAPFYVIRHLRESLPTTAGKPEETTWGALVPGLSVLFAIVALAGSVGASLLKLPGLVRPWLELIPYQQQYEMAQGASGLRQRYQDDFGSIIRNAADETLVIFVDDIDRISGSRVLELLETLNFIVTSAQTRRFGDPGKGAKLYFVLAMNVPQVVRVLGPALDSSNRLTDDARAYLATSYLAKLVDLTVRIPSLADRSITTLFEYKKPA